MMKVIDLLNKIANGEETPKKFKYYTIYTKDIEGFYRNENGVVFDEMIILEDLNDKIEIIEDTPKEDKKIDKLDLQYKDISKGIKFEEQILMYCDNLQYKINEIIDRLNGEE